MTYRTAPSRRRQEVYKDDAQWKKLERAKDNQGSRRQRQLRASIWVEQSVTTVKRREESLLDAFASQVATYVVDHREELLEIAAEHLEPTPKLVEPPVPSGVTARVSKDQHSRLKHAPTPPQTHRKMDPRLEGIIHDLEAVVRRELQSQERWREDNEPFLSVECSNAPSHLHDHWDNICSTDGAEPILLETKLDDVAEMFASIPSRRLVVLGRGGAGKTTFSIKFALALLDSTRRSPNEVPAVFQIVSWNPEQELDDWLTDQLITNPALDEILQRRTKLAAELVKARHIVPVLDGLDEIDPTLRAVAIRKINASRSYREPLIITSRPDEYIDAIESSGYIDYAPAVALNDVTPDEISRYLPLTALKLKPDEKLNQEHENRTAWDPVIAAIRAAEEGGQGAILREVLSTPLMVFLARKIYSDDSSSDVSDLLDPGRFPDANVLSSHLIDQYVRTIYEHPPRDRASTEDSLSPEDAHYRLACYAVFLHSFGVRGWSSYNNELKKTRSIDVPFPMSKIKFLAEIYRREGMEKAVAKRYRGARFPRFTDEFLEDARRRGILRKSGQDYEFRHVLLQDRLAYDALMGPQRRRLGRPSFRSRAMEHLASILLRSGQFKEAEPLLVEALHLQNNFPHRADGPFKRRPAKWHIEYGERDVHWEMNVYKGGSSSGTLVLRGFRAE